MKRISCCVLLMSFLATQTLQASITDVPSAVLNAFAKKFPQVEDTNWSQSGKFYVADFFHDKDGFFKEATFDTEGTWVLTVSDIDGVDLPDEAQDYLIKQFEDLDFLESVKMEERPDSVKYLIVVETEEEELTLIFDETGNLLEE